jgi:DNA invertase Pin-like site-specific DNA recombinase
MAKAQAERLATGAGKLIGYIRVSTTDQGKHGHSLDGQETRLRECAAREGFEVVEIIREVASGAKERDGLAEAQARLLTGEAQGLVFPKIDRVGRSQIHLLHLVKWAEENHIDLLSADEGWQVRDGKRIDKMLPFRLAMAEVELERIRERTRDGLRAAAAKGVRLGRPATHTGEVAEVAASLRRQGRTLQGIADELTARGYRNARGAAFSPMTVWNMVNRVDPAVNPEGGYRGNPVGAAA